MLPILRYALFYAVCVAILAVCFLAWTAMLSPYRMPPEMRQGVVDAQRAK